MPAVTAVPAASTLARSFLHAVLARDDPALRRLLADDVWVRAMLVREIIERHDADGAVELFRGWFGRAHELQVLHASTHPAATREAVAYRLRLRPDWAPDVWHVIEQSGYARFHHGRIRRLDLVCTGFVPEHELERHGHGAW